MTITNTSKLMKNTLTSISTTTSQIVFIDSKVADYQILAAGVVSNTEVVIIEPNQDGIKQITAVLRQKPFSTVHIVSHGSPGCLYLGNSQLSLDTINKYARKLKSWFAPSPHLPISPSPHLLLYGCNVAAGDAGAELIAKLRKITDAEIAASTTRIGNADKGGNWNLDVTTQRINNNLVFTQATQATYSGVFVTYNNTNGSGLIAPGASVTRTFDVTDNLTIENIELGLIATHTWRGDVEVILTSPSGTSVTLIPANASDSFDNFDLLLIDGSPNSFRTNQNEDITAPNYGEDLLAAPANPLSAFAGENSVGTWTLTLDNTNVSGQNRDLTFNSSRLGINEATDPNPLPWEVNPYNSGILVRGAAFISCGTITDNGLNSPVIAVERVDIDANGNPVVPATGEALVENPLRWSHQDWTQEKLGNVYGTDTDPLGNMYAAASANYGAGFGFGTQTATAQINYGSIGGSLANGEGGKTASSSDPTVEANELNAAGTIYKMDAVTGEPTVFAVLPQQSTTVTNIAAESGDPDIVRENTGVGLGNVHYDKNNDQVFVSNFEDGRIYRLDTNGNILDSYDPGILDDDRAGAVPIDELVYGLTVSPDGSQLFFGKNRTVYSIDLNSDGSFPGTVNNSTNSASYTWDNYTGATETLHSTIPNSVTNIFGIANLDAIISDLDFLPTGELVVGGRIYADDNIFSSYNHGGHNYILEDTTTPGLYDVQTEIVGFSTSTQNGGDDGYGGVAYAKQLDNSFNYVFSSADIIEEQGPHGLAIFPDNYTVENVVNDDDPQATADGNEIVPRGAISYGLDGDFKGVGGDVDVFNPGSIQGNVLQDTNNDGNGDTAIADVELTLLDSDGNTIATTTTDTNGNYVFDNLLPGNYTVVQTQPAGLESVSENEGGADNDGFAQGSLLNNQISAIVSPEENDLANDFVEATTAPTLYKLGNRVWNDENGNGSIDGNEPGIAGVTVNLLDNSGNAIASTTTDADGYYLFSDIPAGDYVVEIAPDNFNSGRVLENLVSSTIDETNPNNDADSNDNGLGRTPDPTNGIRSGTITLGPGTSEPTGETDVAPSGNTNDPDNQANLTVDFGMFEPTRVGDTVFNDTDLDGIQDPGETGVPDVTVTLTGGGTDGVIGTGGDDTTVTTTTDENGNYSFAIDNPDPNEDYQVTFEPASLPTGASFTTANAGSDDTVDSDADSSGETSVFNLTPGVNDLSIDAGIVQAATVGDTVFEDIDGDGIQDAGEPGLPGVTVTLTGAGADGVIGTADDTTVTTTTDSNGNYSFDINSPDPTEEYQVSFDISNLPADSEFTTTDAGNDDNFDSDANSSGVTPIFTVASGENNLSLDAGVIRPASLGDTVFEDTDGDGIQDAGEPGISEVTVTLTGGGTDGVIGTGGDDTTVTTTTDSNGNYSFDNLNPGEEYQVSFDTSNVPAGSEFSPANQGGDDTVDSDVNSSGVTPIIILDSAENNTSIDAGLIIASTDYGDAPDTTSGTDTGDYQTLEVNGGPSHLLRDDLSIGATVDPDNGRLENAAANADDIDGSDDEDGVIFTEATGTTINSNNADNSYSVDVIVNAPTSVSATDNFESGDYVSGTGEWNSGWTETFDNPTDPNAGRIQIVNVNGDNILRYQNDSASISRQFDFSLATGDATLTFGYSQQNLVAGQSYLVSVSDGLGATPVSFEIDETAPQNNTASGLATLNIPQSLLTDTTTISITQGPDGNTMGDTEFLYIDDISFTAPVETTLTSWIDFNRDGVFDSTERVTKSTTDAVDPLVVDGITPNTIEWQNFTSQITSEGDTYARFRLSTDSASVQNATGASPSGEVEDYQLAIATLYSISGTVLNDTNNPDDTPIPGVTVELFANDGAGNPTGGAIANEVTDADGVYTFTDIPNGDYVVVQTQPTNFSSVTDSDGVDDNQIAVTIAGADSIGNDFLEAVYSISGTVLNDTNNPNDTPIPGVTVELFANDGAGNPTGSAIASDVTDANGVYTFTDILNGDYVVVQTQPDGFISVTDSDGGTDSQIAVTIAGADSTGNDFLEETPPDYGDAPDSYGTTAANNGAKHPIVAGLSIGANIDADDGTLSNVAADADDTLGGNDDEDGVTFTEGTAIDKNDADNSYSVDVSVNRPSTTDELARDNFDTNTYNGGTGWAAGSVWVDYEDETATIVDTDHNNNNVVVSGNSIQITNEGRATERLIDLSGRTGKIDLNFDYQTIGNINASTHSLDILVSDDGTVGGLQLADTITSNSNGSFTAESVDITNFINSGGNTLIRFRIKNPGNINTGDGYDLDNIQVTETTTDDVTLVSWIDFNRDGDFDDPGEGVVNSTANGDLNTDGTSTTVTWTNFTDDIASNGNTYARFRLSTDELSVDDSTGAASDGEVEDYQLFVTGVQPDYGDAPDSLSGSVSAADNLINNGNDIPDYRTTEADGGASHAQDEDSAITIGSTVDTESDALPNDTATGDDNNGDDEDGVFVAGTTDALNGADIIANVGSSYSIDVVVDAEAPVATNSNAVDITGIAYRDYDLNGTQKPATTGANGQAGGEPGIGGITVNAYDDNGIVASAITSNDPTTLGQYTLNIPANAQSKLRLEFIAPDVEAGGSGEGEGSLVRFVDTLNDPVSEIDVALNNPGEYVGNTNPYLFTSCFVIGDQVSSTNEHTLVAYRYDGSTPDNNPIFLADADEIGSVYGLDFERNSQNIYASTYTKTHAGYGPGGAGAVYQIPITDLNSATAGTPTEYVDLNNIFGAGTVTGVTRNYGSDPNNWLRDNAGFQGVGKTSLGDLDITEDGKYIMVVNLEDKRLYAIPTSGALNSSTIKRFDIPNPNTGAREADIRPFGLGINDGKIYVGMVDSAQSTGNRADLQAYVYEFDFDSDTATGTFNNTPVVTHGLDYPRGDAWDSRGISADWQPWQDDFSEFTDGDRTDGYHTEPEATTNSRYNWLEGAQPMLSDIEFDNGSMILGFRDRLADQSGSNVFNPVDPNDLTEYYVFQAGDILRAAPNGSGGFNVESGGTVDDGFGGTLSSSNTTNNEGPGGGEFYYDNFGGHEQQSLGSLVHLPGFDETAYNAGLGNNRGGTVVVSNVDGSNVDGGTTPREILYTLTPEDTAFNKANGLGDLEAFEETAPIEIGNRIFLDKDEDGIQDANESGIADITVRLFSGGTQIATAVTDADGQYSFGGVDAPDLLAPNTAYEIRIDKGAGTPIENYNLTLQDANSNGSDSIDSDAVDNAGTPTINFTTGEAGENNFTLDAGFTRGITLVGWIDFNRDGVFSDSEAVTLDTDDPQPLVTDGSTPNTLEFTVPADVEPGVTAARFRVASGLTGDKLDGTTANGALPNGEVEDYMVNLVPVFAISGTVLSDTLNPAANAIDNPGDTPIPGVTLNLYADSDGDGNPDTDGAGNLLPPIDTQVTGADGSYSFTGLTNGNYVVVQEQPTGFDSVTDSDGAPDNQISVTINGADVTGNNFLEEKEVAIGSTVFRDTNNNGLQDAGESGIEGVSVQLYSPGADGAIGGGDDSLVNSTNTDVNGNYIFDNLPEGDYYVSIPETNFADGGALEGTPLSSVTTETTDNEIDGDDNGIQGSIGDVTNSPVINLTANSEPIDAGAETAQGNELDNDGDDADGDMTIDFGFTSVFTVSGTVFEDTNNPNDNTIEAGDTPIPGVEVELFAVDGSGNIVGNAIATTTTNTFGVYEFPNIGNGNYVVVQTQPTGFNSVTDSDGAPDNQIAVNVNNADSTDNNFLEERPAGSVSGRVRDTDNNGINNVTLNLINSDGQIVDTVSTNSTGDYTFDYVLPGNYTVQQVQPFGYNSVSEVEGGTDGDNPGNDNTVNNRISVTVGLNDADGGDDIGNDFVEIRARDYGDAPDNQPGTGTGNYRTREADNGASHNVISGLRIGNNIDTDSGTLQNTTATADDNSAAVDDEDGVNFSSNLQTDDTTYSVDVSVTNNTGQDATLVGWVDFDRSGTFDADEAVSRTIAAGSGTSNVSLTWDNDAGNNGDGNGDLPATIEAGTTYSRFRLSTDASLTGTIDNADSIGNLPDGEVEDHQFDIGSSGAGGGITTPADCIFIGQQNVELTVTFDNTGAIPGYGPFALLYLDKTGADGAGAEIDDGLTFKTAQYLGVDVVQQEYTFDENGEAEVTIGNQVETITAPPGFEPGDTVVYMELPFGSFVPDQPPADITVTVDVSDLADNNTPLNVLSQTGYKFGEDPLDNPDTDPIILEDISAKPNDTITPQIVKITNNYLGPEDETATGPNFVQQYQIVVDIAPGQTLTNLDISDLLPDTMQFVDVASIEIADSGAGGVNNGVTISDISTPDDGGLTSIGSTNTTENDVDNDGNPTPGGTLTRRFSSVTGVDGADDIVITVDFFVPRLDASGDVIINADSGDDVFDQNQSQLGDNVTTDGNNIWTANDPRDGDAEVYIAPTINDETPDPTFPNGSGTESDTGDICNDPDHVLEEQSIAIQKNVANLTDSGNSPGDVLEYTLNFQVSDYFAFQNIVVTDTFSDGQRFDTTFTPVVSISEHNTNTNDLDFTYSDYTPANDTLAGGRSNDNETLIIDETDIDNTNDGSGNTVLTFNVSDELIASGFDPQLIGGGVPQGGFQDIADLNNNPPLPNNGTVGTITFRTIIQDEYNDNFPSGDASLDQNDLLTNDAIIDGAVLDVLDPNANNGTEDALTPTGQREDDDTAASLTIEEGNLFKTIYAVNGVIAPGADTDNNLSDGLDGYSGVEVAPGDTITYRLTYQLPISDVEELQFTDFFPLPVFDVGTEFAGTTFDTTFDTTGATIPAAGETHYGRLDTFHSLTGAPVPNLSVDAAGNSLNYFYGDFDDPNNSASVVDLLVTVTTENDPFADNLLLTNQVRQSQENTFNEVSTRDAIVQITLREPVLEIKKGVVAVDSDRTDLAFNPTTASPSEITFTPGSAPTFGGDGVVSSTDLDTAPINSNLTGGLEAGDIVTFALAVENTGGSRKGAFDVRIQDALPDGFEIPAGGLNLNVTDGTGATLTYNGLGDPQGVGDDLFGNGIELIDPGATPSSGTGLEAQTDAGAIDGFNETSGRNIAIVSYDLRVTTPSPYVDPATLENTARVVSYSNLEGGESFPSIQDNATVEIERPEAIKSIVTTSEVHTPETGDGSNNANARETTIGEIVRYRLVARIPEGNAVDFILRDSLPNGQTFLNDGTSTVAFVSNGGGISSSNPNGSTLNLGLGTTPANSGNSPDDATNFVTLGDNAIGSNNSITDNADNYSTGIDVRFKLGDVINSDRDADDEFIVIEFNALVDNNNDVNNQGNEIRNDAGDIKNNSFRIISDGTTLDTSNTVRVAVVEPVIDNVDQTVSLDGTNFSESVNADSQDIVTFKVTFSNTGSSTAYDVNLTDDLPTGLENFTFDPNTNVTLSNGATGAAVNPNANADNELDLIVDAIPVGGSVTVTYTAQVVNGVAPDLAIANTADVTYTSLPGTGTTSNPTGSTTPGTSGAINGERDGSDGEGVNPNDYADSDPATVNTPPLNPVKSLVATSESFTGTDEGASATDSDLTIGEIARYRMVVQIPEGNTNNLVISDLLPTGLRYLDDGTSQIALVSDGGLTSDTITDPDTASPNLASSDPNITPEFDITASDSADAGTTFESGEDPTFNLGNLTNTDSDANSELVVIEFNALVENITANQDPGTLDNSFTVDADNATARTSNVVSIDLVEPVIDNVDQTVSLDGTNFTESVNADSQDVVTFKVTFSNTGNSTAYDVDLSDTLPTGELENLSVIDITSSSGVTGVVDTSNTTDLDIAIESIPVGESVTVTYTAQVVDGVAPDLNITNTADVTYTSLPGTGTTPNPTGSTTPGTSGAINGERNGSDGEGVNLNNYADSDPADVNINNYSIGSTVFADTNNNGILDAGETGIPGVTVRLFDNANNEIPVGPDGILGTADDALGGVTTNSDGNYIFTGLEPGQYQVKIPASNFDPDGALDNASLSSANTTTTDNQIDNDDNGIQSELGTEVTSPIITLSAGDEPTTAETAPGGSLDDASDDDANGDMTVDFGFVPTASLGNLVFFDDDGDGIQDNNEFGVDGVTVNLIGGGADGIIEDNPDTPEDESDDNTTQTTKSFPFFQTYPLK